MGSVEGLGVGVRRYRSGRLRMDLREAISLEANSPPVRPRFGGSSPSRAALLGSCAVVLIVAGIQTCKGLMAWVGEDPYHRLSFQAIELTEPLPRWIPGSREQFLEGVRRQSDLPETIRMLEIPLGDLERAFRASPWVESVDRIERIFPNRIRATLRYREPVASLSWNGSSPSVILDKEGDVLPDEIDRSASLPLAEIKGLPGRFDARAGHPLRIAGGDDVSARIDPIVAHATRLAGFLKRRGALDVSADPPRNIVALAVRIERRRLYLYSRSGFYISWGEVSESEFDDAKARTRWILLIDWFRRHPASAVRYPAYLKFVGDEPVLSNDPAEAARRTDRADDRFR